MPPAQAQAGTVQKIWDFIGSPLRMVLLPDESSRRLGLTSLEDERINAVLPHIRGRLLDVGAGKNTLVRRYGNGVGVEVFDWGGGAQLIEDSAHLPFEDASFDTVTFVASLNHIPERREALQEAARVLCPGGRLLITMISAFLGGIGHRIWWYSEDKTRQIADGELDGMNAADIWQLCREAGFEPVWRRRFLYGMNNLYLGRLPE